MTNETPTITTEAARQAAEDYRRAELDLLRVEGDIKAQKAAIDAKYEETIADLTLLQNDSRETLAAYAEAKREDLLSGDKKSTSFYGLTIRWKMTPPKLAMRRAKDTWAKVMQRMREAKLDAYIKVKEDIDKTALKKADPAILAQIGVEFQQEERFEIKL